MYPTLTLHLYTRIFQEALPASAEIKTTLGAHKAGAIRELCVLYLNFTAVLAYFSLK